MSNEQSSQAYRVADEGSIHKYATLVPNTVVRGLKSRHLSVYAKWLYVYIKSRAGDNGSCYTSTTTIAEEAGMSRGQVSAAKKELLQHGLISLRPGKNPRRNTDTMRIKDIWLANMQEFSVHNMNTDDDGDESADRGNDASSVHNTNTDDASVHSMNTVFTIRTQCSPHEQLRSIPKEVLLKKEVPPLSPQGETRANQQGQATDAQETRQTDNLPVGAEAGKGATRNTITGKQRREREKPRPSKHVPATWELTPELRQWAATEVPGVNVEYETNKFRDWEFKDPRTDWNATWRNWLRHAWEKLPHEARQPRRASQPFKVVL